MQSTSIQFGGVGQSSATHKDLIEAKKKMT